MICLLVGQLTLRRRIKLGTFAALDQRIALRYAMTGMTNTETASYIGHHLKLAGRSDNRIHGCQDSTDAMDSPDRTHSGGDGSGSGSGSDG